MKVESKERAEEKRKLRLGFIVMFVSVVFILTGLLTCLSCDPNPGNKGLDESEISEQTYFWENLMLSSTWEPQIAVGNNGIPPFYFEPLTLEIGKDFINMDKLSVKFIDSDGCCVENGQITVLGNEGEILLSDGDKYKLKFSSNPDKSEPVITISFEKDIYYSLSIL